MRDLFSLLFTNPMPRKFYIFLVINDGHLKVKQLNMDGKGNSSTGEYTLDI